MAGCLIALDADSVRYTIDTSGSRMVISAFGKRLEGPPISRRAPLTLELAPQERYSTGQLLLRDRSPLVNGLRIVRFMVFGRSGTAVRQSVVPDGVTRFVHFNPFRAPILVRAGDKEVCRVEVNVPDATVELWQQGNKLQDVQVRPPWLRLTIAPLIAAVAAALLIAVGLGLLRPGPSERRSVAAVPTDGARLRVTITTVAVFAVGAAAAAAVLLRVSHAIPGFGDEINYLFEGKILASGRLAVPQPPLSEFFRVGWTDLWWTDGKVWGFHPPGNSALLALGWLVGVPWLTIPLVTGGILAVQHRLALNLLGSEPFALLHVAIVASSHYVLALAGSYMAHAPSMLFISLFFLAALRFVRSGSRRALVLAALFIGVAFVIRPLSALLAATIPLLLLATRVRAKNLWTYCVAVLVGLAVASMAFLYTWGITGRFTLSYMVKGPEVGETLAVRLAEPMETHLADLYRNCNELQHRVHSFGILGNMVFFALALVVVVGRRGEKWAAIAAAIFAFYVVGHSLLHWYGWKWEPRMLYDVSFLFFLLTSAGVKAALTSRGVRQSVRVLTGIVVVGGVAWAAGIDVPRRFATEYQGYNSEPAGVMEQLKARRIRSGVVLFGSEMAYASYLPFNAVTFDGPLVYARSLGENYDYKLLTRFPTRPTYFSPDGETLVPRPNFYHHDLARLQRDIGRLGGQSVTVVMPWLRVAPTDLNGKLHAWVADPGTFLQSLASQGPQAVGWHTVVFLGSATELASLVDRVAETRVIDLDGYETPVACRSVGALRAGAETRFPGLRMTCYQGTGWSGKPIDRQLVTSLDLDPCFGENRSIVWDAEFELAGRRTFKFALDSDDGSGLFIDGRIVINNGIGMTHGPETKSAEATLEPGRHSLQLRYFNGPDGEFLKLKVDDGSGSPRPLSAIAPFGGGYLFVDLPREPGAEAAR